MHVVDPDKPLDKAISRGFKYKGSNCQYTDLYQIRMGYDTKSANTSKKKIRDFYNRIPGKIQNMDKEKKTEIIYSSEGKPITKDNLMMALYRNDGRLMRALSDLKVESYVQAQKLMQTNAEFKDLERYFRQKLCDKAEDVIYDCLNGNDKTLKLKSAMFVLECIGKSQGWSKQPNQPLINVDLRDNPDKLQEKVKSIFNCNNSSGSIPDNDSSVVQIPDKEKEDEDKIEEVMKEIEEDDKKKKEEKEI